jgi:putative SOS response-associated peptidase YedK
MCGRFTLTPEPSEILTAFPDLDLPDGVVPRWNVAPTDSVLAVTERNGERALEKLKWGLVPSWAKDPKIGSSLINARADSLRDKPAFRNAFKKRRCLVLADGFFEWRHEGKKKKPIYFRMKDGSIFAFAGLWEVWKPAEGGDYLLSCTIVTTAPNALVSPIHDRMPAVVAREAYGAWLEGSEEAAEAVLGPYDAERMVGYEVSSAVNSPRNDSPECIRPVSSVEPLELF